MRCGDAELTGMNLSVSGVRKKARDMTAGFSQHGSRKTLLPLVLA